MTRQALIERTVEAMGQLPVEKLQEVSDFAHFILKQYDPDYAVGFVAKVGSAQPARVSPRRDSRSYRAEGKPGKAIGGKAIPGCSRTFTAYSGYEETLLTQGAQALAGRGQTFDFLKVEEDLEQVGDGKR